jgi:hypothetical protein
MTIDEMKRAARENDLCGEDIGGLFYKEEECSKMSVDEAVDHMVRELGVGEFHDLFTSMLADL